MMNCYSMFALILITHTVSIWSAPTLIPYDAHGNRRQETIALYRRIKGSSADIPLVLDEGYHDETEQLPRASIFVDNNAVIGLIIYTPRTVLGRPTAHISKLMMDHQHENQASDLLRAFEQQKRAEHRVQISADINVSNKNFFSRAGFVKTKDESLMSKNIAGGACCVQ